MHSHKNSAEIVITGMGLATGLGRDVDATWAAIRAGKIGLGPMGAMESALPEGAIGGQALDLPEDFAKGLPREVRYLRWVITHALKSAGADGAHGTVKNPERRAIVLGTTLHGIRAGGRFLRSDDPGELEHFLSNAITARAIEGLGIEGLSATTCSACSSSLGAIALGVTLLETGQADMVVAGGYDAVSEYVWAGFNSLRLVAPKAVMPFAKQRQGMMVAEGYGVVVLERASDCAKRGARALIVVKGWGESADSHHLTQPDPKGAGAGRAIRDALARAGTEASEISMIAAHATATPDNDAAEYAGFASVFGGGLAKTPIVGFKSYLGHTLGGAGAVELILSACALESGWIPPCATVQQADVEFADMAVAAPGGIHGAISKSLNTSLGFGGANTCMILERVDGAVAACEVREASKLEPEVWITGYGLMLPGISNVSTLLGKLLETSGVVAGRGATVSDDQFAQVLNVRRVRRMSMYVKLMLSSVALAIKHSGLEGDAARLELASAMLASTHGSPGFCADYYSQIVREGVLGANPVLFAEGVPNAGAAHVSTNFGIKGACQTIIGSRTAGIDALGLAAMRIQTGASDIVVVGAAEETHSCVDRAYQHCGFGKESGEGSGFFLTPGSVSLILESSISAAARGVKPLAKVGKYAAVSGVNSALNSPQRVLKLIGARGTVLGSGNSTWIDRAEAVGAQRMPGVELTESLHDRVGDLFSAGPLLGIVREIAGGRPSTLTSLCTDFTGLASAIAIETCLQENSKSV